MKFTANEPVVTDGPFAGTKELIAGFWIWQVKSMDDAVEWLKRSPFGDGAELEIRQFHEPEDFASLGRDVVAEHNQLRAVSERQAKSANKSMGSAAK